MIHDLKQPYDSIICYSFVSVAIIEHYLLLKTALSNIARRSFLLQEVKASCLKTLTAIIHLDRNPRFVFYFIFDI